MDYSGRTDAELFLIFKSGDTKGFNGLFNRHWMGLFRLAYKILENKELAKDVVQEIFLSLYESISHNEIHQIKGYLFQSVKYQCFMHLRSGRISEKHLSRLQHVMASNYTEEKMEADELETILNHRIDCLPERCRQVFYLSRYHYLSNRKIAEQLNISQKTVEHQISKALKTLRIYVDKLAIIAWMIIS